jgi:hypothetical protein
MQKIEDFYFEESDESGEAVFNKFAEKHAHLFDEGCNALDGESKLE